MPLNIFLALRLLSRSNYEKNKATMVLVCFLSLTISTFALTLIAAIANGFEKETSKKLQSIHSDITISSNGLPLNEAKLLNVIKKEFADAIESISPVATSQVIIQKKNSESIPTNVVIIKAIDPNNQAKVSKLEKMLTSSAIKAKSLGAAVANNSILIGHTLAKQLNLKLGDPVDLLFQPEEITGNKITLEKVATQIGGIFNTGISEFDEHLIYCSLDFFNQIFTIGVTEFAVKLKKNANEKEVIDRLKKRVSLDVYSWKDLYPSLISAQILEKYALIIILSLVVIIAAMNMISLLYIYITQKRGEIALLKAMGTSDFTLISAFILVGLIITAISSFVGILLAWFCVLLLNKYPFIKLPDVYYVSHLPAQLDLQIILIVLAIVFVVSFIALYIPTRNIKNINITQVLKNELA